MLSGAGQPRGLGALAGTMQLLDAGIGLFEHDLGKGAGPLLSSSDFVDTKRPFELEI
ncbi:MAG: hypothetical protein WBX22_17475 [Silvibacterium sp.]